MTRSVRMLLLGGLLAHAPDALAQAAGPPDVRAMQKASFDLTASYLRTWSMPQAATAPYVERVYADRVSFYGRTLDRNGLLDEKKRFVRRWPVRRYAVRPGTVRVFCDGAARSCRLLSVLDWQAASPARRAAARGSSSFEQRIDFSAARPAVVHESGRVLPNRG